MNLPPPSSGNAKTLGATPEAEGTNFALFSAHATGVDLCLFSPDGNDEIARVPLPEHTDGVWHGFFPGIEAGQLYGYRVHGPYEPEEGQRFNAHKLLIDPYAKALHGGFQLNDALYGFDPKSKKKDLSFSKVDSAPFMPKCVVYQPDYAWGKDGAPRVPARDTIIYEAHVRGISKRHSGINAKKRGTFDALADAKMIDHLVDLGVTSIELLPVQAFFPEPRLSEMGLTNYWGYNPAAYFVPEASYMGPSGKQSFQKMVKALHAAGIEVILDVVYNHTAESWELGPTLSWRGIDNQSYYRLKEDNPRFYVNDTGCGNTLNVSHPRVLQMVMDSLRYWVTEMHVDGFRFDLATTVARTREGFAPDGAFLSAMLQDPVLSRVKLIAEPWDIGPGGYQLGQFPAGWQEWNDRFRDRTRAFWRGDSGARAELASPLLGSAEYFDHSGRRADASVNFITSHDGFTLRDVVSYNDKHNEANGEQNRDGHGHNISDNCGAEGPTDDEAILARRARRSRNLLATLMLAQGTPMLLAGDEIGHSQGGNNNAYCQDNETTWLNWNEADEALRAFTAQLVRIRRANPLLSQAKFLHGEEVDGGPQRTVVWLNGNGEEMTSADWDDASARTLIAQLSDSASSLIIIQHAGDNVFDFPLPEGTAWKRILDTSRSGDEFADEPTSASVAVAAESTVVLVSTAGGAA
ncbi:glycogen debranching protein GlgX [Kordiimonas gwangyangensis]|uniref:glycogen debranching protein GlgX n=1 Tax=Kordiimonas gwangyangensis TaxID=288022 RepID=UPI000379A240|nr:glycogen debranching protein GlgX [Kordiimonas gwangyangensis]